MNDDDSQRRPFQYSLWSLFVLTTFVAILCSIGVCTDWSVPLTLVVGRGICSVGFGKLSFRKHPDAGYLFAVAGFIIRLIGLGIVAFGLILWIAMGVWRMR